MKVFIWVPIPGFFHRIRWGIYIFIRIPDIHSKITRGEISVRKFKFNQKQGHRLLNTQAQNKGGKKQICTLHFGKIYRYFAILL